jgi:PPOX class probable F420-dependent enzyme
MSDKNFIDNFLAEPYLCRFALNRGERAPLIRPVWYLWEDGQLMMSTSGDASHIKAIRKDPNISVCIDKASPPYAALVAEGKAELVQGLGTDHALLRRLADRYLPAERVDGFMQRPMAQIERVRIIVEPQRWTVWNNDPEAPIAARSAVYR